MKQYTHGGDTVGFARKYGIKPLDFSANTNPLGMSPLARQAIIDSLDNADTYPDPLCRELRAALAKHEGVDAGRIVCGNGAADLIFRLARCMQPKKALLTAPTFSEYQQALEQAGCDIVHHVLSAENDFALTEAILGDIDGDTDMLFLCEPNNPTGAVSSPALLDRVMDRCRQTGTTVVVDECFNGFLQDGGEHSCKRHLGNTPGLVILKAYTKLYGMAGVRLGYVLCGSEALADEIYNYGQPWAVSTPAQAAGVAALDDRDYVQECISMVTAQRAILAAGLGRLGYRVFPSQANYILFHTPDVDLQLKMGEKGILIRSCANYHGLGAGYYRIAVKRPEQNEALLAALEEVANWER